MRFLLPFLGVAAAAAAVGASPAEALMNGGDEKAMARARDGNIAIRQELEQARRSNSVAAYDLFIARHPKHTLAKVAREERERLLRTLRSR
jgi:hypothetical protein